MLTRLITGIAFAIAAGAIGRGIVYAFSLDVLVAHVIRATMDAQSLAAISWIIAGIIGVAALIGWVSIRADERIYNWWAPIPALGSFHVTGKPTLDLIRDQKNNRTDAVMAVTLHNANDHLVAYRCELKATANGKDLHAPIVSNGYVSAKSDGSLIVHMDDIPNIITNDVLNVEARMRYDVFYYFPNNPKRERRTAKLVQWAGKYPASGLKVWSQIIDPMYVRYADAVEE